MCDAPSLSCRSLSNSCSNGFVRLCKLSVASSAVSSRLCFNPRPREGGDAVLGMFGLGNAVVSIHAPAKGATGSVTAGPRA